MFKKKGGLHKMAETSLKKEEHECNCEISTGEDSICKAECSLSEEKEEERMKIFMPGLHEVEETSSDKAECNCETSTSEESIHKVKCSLSDDEEWSKIFVPGTWGTHELEENPWDDRNKPVVHLFAYEDLTLTDQEKEGILSERIVAACSSYLDRCPETGKYVLCKCCLQHKGLVDVSVLTYHHYLQYLDLSYNQLTDLSSLGQMPFLMYLNVSHNSLTELLNFKPPFNLTYVDYSYNKLRDIGDLSKFWSIIHLNLSHNKLFLIRGLDKLRYLRNLDLSYNSIKCLENLNGMNLVTLNLESNKVSSFELGEDVGLKTLKFIQTINLSHNCLKTLKLFTDANSIRQIIMESNQLKDLLQLTYLKNLCFLTDVNFRNNRMCLADKYMETCIHIIKPVRVVDGQCITAVEKVAVKNRFEPIPEVQAADKHSKLLLLEQLKNFNVTPTVLPVDENIPCILALVGPPESKHDKLAADFYNSYSRYVELGVNHTTRPKLEGETEGETYYFVSEAKFKELISEGTFISVTEHFGYSYGLSQSEIVKVMNKKHILVTHTDLVGAINLKLFNLNTKLILALPSKDKEYHKNLTERYYFEQKQSRQMNFIKIMDNCQKGEANVEEQWCSCNSDVFSIVTNILADLLGYDSDAEIKSEKQASIKFLENVRRNFETDSNSEEIFDDYPTYREESEKRKDFTSDRSQSTSEIEFEEEPGFSKPFLDDNAVTDERQQSPNDDIQRVFREIIGMRRTYIEFHRANPGFFCQTVYTDKDDDAMMKLRSVLKEIVMNPKKTSHVYNYDADPDYDEMINDKLKRLDDDIRW